MNTKVTDLEKFALEQIIKPYQSLLPEGTYDDVTELLQNPEYSAWSELVLNRIKRCGFWFPDYINHPLVDLIRERTI